MLFPWYLFTDEDLGVHEIQIMTAAAGDDIAIANDTNIHIFIQQSKLNKIIRKNIMDLLSTSDFLCNE